MAIRPALRDWVLPWCLTAVGSMGVFLVLVLLYPLVLPVPDVAPSVVERWIEPLGGRPWTQASFAALARETPGLDAARWEPVTLPFASGLPVASSVPDDSAISRAWYRTRFVVPADHRPETPVAVYVSRIWGGAYTVWVNGALVSANIDDWRMQWNVPLYTELPLHWSRPGQVLEIAVAVPFREVEGHGIGTLYVGAREAVALAWGARVFVQSTLPRAGMLVILLVGLLSLQVWFTRRSETPYLVFALSALFWSIFDLQYFYDISSDGMAAKWLATAVDSALGWAFAGLYAFVLRVENRREPVTEKVLFGYAALVTFITLPVWNWETNAFLLEHYGDLGVLLFVVSRTTYFAVRGRRTETRILAVSAWGLVVMGAYDLVYLTGQRVPDGVNLSTYGAFLIFFAHLIAMQRRYVQALQSYEDLNVSLSQRLVARETELRDNYRQLSQAEQERTLLLERQRLLQDMHDGIGASLISSLVMVENGQLPGGSLAAVLRECIDELRLVIESLEPIDHDLVTLLATLRHRLGRRFEAAGIRLIWKMDDLPALAWLDPPAALHVLRIVQEALTNILKHARAGQVMFTAALEPGGDGRVVRVCIEDDGVGLGPEVAGAGRGLAHMHKRAGQIGGAVTVAPGRRGGTRVELRLPVGAVLAAE